MQASKKAHRTRTFQLSRQLFKETVALVHVPMKRKRQIKQRIRVEIRLDQHSGHGVAVAQVAMEFVHSSQGLSQGSSQGSPLEPNVKVCLGRTLQLITPDD